ncbi:MAG: metallopeptidase TldD-related protein [Acidimicrobiales bacterium]
MPPAQELIDACLDAARDDTDGCVVVVDEADEVEIRFANNTTTTNGVRHDRRVTVVALRSLDGEMAAGVVRRGGDVEPTSLVMAAAGHASVGEPAEDAAPLLAPFDTGAGSGSNRTFDQTPAAGDLSLLSTTVDELAGAFRRARTAGHVLAGAVEHGRATTYVGTSTGVRLAHSQPSGTFQLAARDIDGERSAWVGKATTDFEDVAVDALHDQLQRRLAWAARRIDWPAGRTEVLLAPEAVSDLMIALAFDASGRNAEDGRTVFSRSGGGTRVGDQLSAIPFQLWSDPYESGLECRPFVVATSSSTDTSIFDNGMPLARTEWILDGRCHRLRYHRAGAARSGVSPAGFIGNLVLESPTATADEEELVRRTERGLLLTCLWYLREVDPVTMLLTGLTRDGVYVVENGTVVGATTNFRFNESPVDLLARATEVGTSRKALGREFGESLPLTAMPMLRIADFNLSSVSRAT